MEGKRIFFFYGGVQAEIIGQDQERFLNIAVQREFSLYQISARNGNITFWTRPDELKKMKQIMKKTGVKVKVIDRYGLPFLLHRNRMRKFAAAGAVLFFLILYSMTFYIWDISFDGNYKFTDETLLHYMETIPVVYGMKKKEISCEALESKIRNAFAEITWVSAEIKGTRLIVRIKENEVLTAPIKKNTDPCDLAAKKDGTVVRTVVRSGRAQVKAGDQVETGTLLVDGTIPIYDDSENLVNSHEVHADAEIYAETVHTVKKSLPLFENVRYRTGKEKRGAFIRILNHSFYFLLPESLEAKWEYVTEEYQGKIFEDFYLPFYIGMIHGYEYEVYESAYTEEKAFSIGQRDMMEYMENLSEKGIQILGNDGKIERSESGWQFEGTIAVIEDIAEEVPIPEKQEEIQTGNERN